MDTDLVLVAGIVLVVLAIPSLLAAFSESHPPRTGAILILVGGVLIVLALSRHATGYSFQEIPDVFLRVFARYLG